MSRRGWIFSAILHAALIALAAFGLPKLFEPELSTAPEPIVVGIGPRCFSLGKLSRRVGTTPNKGVYA